MYHSVCMGHMQWCNAVSLWTNMHGYGPLCLQQWPSIVE